MLMLGGYDPLHDEGLAYAEKLKAAGVKVTIADYADMVHCFIYLQTVLPQAHEAVAKAARAVKALWTPPVKARARLSMPLGSSICLMPRRNFSSSGSSGPVNSASAFSASSRTDRLGPRHFPARADKSWSGAFAPSWQASLTLASTTPWAPLRGVPARMARSRLARIAA